jgi:acyl CoA:acetate/3-ketoacid CoA transferase beta subunit
MPRVPPKVVKRIITNLGIFDIKERLELVAKSHDTNIEEIVAQTGANFTVNFDETLMRQISTIRS